MPEGAAYLQTALQGLWGEETVHGAITCWVTIIFSLLSSPLPRFCCQLCTCSLLSQAGKQRKNISFSCRVVRLIRDECFFSLHCQLVCQDTSRTPITPLITGRWQHPVLVTTAFHHLVTSQAATDCRFLG